MKVTIAAVGLYMLWRGAGDWQAGSRSSAWPTVAGTVLESRAETPARGSTYQAHVAYSYKVSGQVYEGDRIGFGMATRGSWQSVQGIIGPYPVGAVVQVHYDPATPDESVLQPGWTGRAVLEMMLGAVMLVVGLFGRVKRRR
ncbi:MAG TPA: DUF3592 domain-containing protein [Gemmatimonadales bacterium]|nr:DUF3592 domain-containing protein [Gemmatimonadales bacterium]